MSEMAWTLEKLPPGARDLTRPMPERVDALIAELTLEEKVAQLLHDTPAIERFGIPPYNWWNECSHGVARAGAATVFPHAIGQAATFNLDLIRRIGVAVSDEARAKHHQAARAGNFADYYGLTFWTPNINIFRDPRWGRGQETYGEDPYLTARMAVAYIQALQGDHPTYYKITACAKHFAAHSGPEHLRHEFNAIVSAHDLWDTYLPAFEASVREAKVEAVMGAYTRTNGEPCCASPTLLQEILRRRWGFEGHVVSDCAAIEDIYLHHAVVASEAEAAALAINNGCDLCCGCAYQALTEAVALGLVSEAAIDAALHRVLLARFRLGMFDPPEQVPYAQIPTTVIECAAHDALATEAACESMVLLKNDGLLPLAKGLREIAVIGPNADDAEVMFGNYYGIPSNPVTIVEGIRRAVSAETAVRYTKGCHINSYDAAEYEVALALARSADVVVFVGGLSQILEGEDGQDEGVPPGTTSQGDRTSLELPAAQQRLLRALHDTGTPVILVIISGSAIAVNWEDEHLPAILHAWYPGQNGGVAVARVLFGDYNPAGRLPVTVYRSIDDVPPFEDYDMHGRTYRYFDKSPLYAFGHGLSYTRFAYRDLRFSSELLGASAPLTVTVTVTNAGERAGDEVIQLYISGPRVAEPYKLRELRGFARVHLEPGETREQSFELMPEAFTRVDQRGERVLDTGEYTITVGGCQPGFEPYPGATISGKVIRTE